MTDQREADEPNTLPFLKLIAHDVRWALVMELGRSDLKVRELVARVGQAGNLVSYHLGLLKEEGVVREHRSTADSREVYYCLDLPTVSRLLVSTASQVHYGLLSDLGGSPLATASGGEGALGRVLFLCTHNSARSQMAEGLLRHLSEDRIEVQSAGSAPTELHPLAVETMRTMGMDIAAQHAKHVDNLVGEHFDFVITLCDSIREVCPTFEGSPVRSHWSLPDPAEATSEKRMREAFRTVASELETRIRYLIPLLEESRKTA